MEPVEIQIIEVPVIIATVIGTKQNGLLSYTLFDCFGDWLALGRDFKVGQQVRIAFTPDHHKGSSARSS